MTRRPAGLLLACAAFCAAGCAAPPVPELDSFPGVAELGARRAPRSPRRVAVECREDPALEEEVASALRRYPVFARVVPAAEADTILRLRLEDQGVRFLGTNDRWGWNVALWLYAWFPSWWVRDEDYEVDQRWALTLSSAASGETLLRMEYDRSRARRPLDDFERGWILWGIWRVPGALGQANWRRVRRSLAPYLRRAVAADVLGLLAGHPDGRWTEETDP
ncbi:MAG: hypothetical protein HY722_13260 [Planctomycetes bacterium]|nr:hypothetical protein [Planctomycetota bacterium]